MTENPNLYLWIIPLLPLTGAAINGFFGKRFSRQAVAGVARRVLKQRGLADARLASDDEDRTLPAEHRTECGIQLVALAGTSP